MNELQKFDFNGKVVSIIDRDGEAWFIAKDVCDVLGIQNSRDTVAKLLDEDEKTTVDNSDARPGHGAQSFTIISESGFYKLVFRSRKKVAKQFTKWVTSEVLPAIRKNGGYIDPAATNAQIKELTAKWEQEKTERHRLVNEYNDLQQKMIISEHYHHESMDESRRKMLQALREGERNQTQLVEENIDLRRQIRRQAEVIKSMAFASAAMAKYH